MLALNSVRHEPVQGLEFRVGDLRKLYLAKVCWILRRRCKIARVFGREHSGADMSG